MLMGLLMNLQLLLISIFCGTKMLKGEYTNKSVEAKEINRAMRDAFRLLDEEPLGGLRGCDSFTFGNPEKKEFYSPNYPLPYENGTSCIRVISADSNGQQVVLDFREKFDMEPSENCKYDYLEVRDGQFGYSPLLGRYCGHDFPPILKSSGQHLWLKFTSDENIEYTGFMAVYEFVEREGEDPMEGKPCFINITDLETETISQTNISSEVWDRSIRTGLDCMFLITVAENKQVSLQWDSFVLQFPNDCEKNYVDVFGEKTDNRLNYFCGAAAEQVVSKDHVMQVHVVLKTSALNSTFRAHFTAFRTSQNCTDDEFNCQDGACIHKDLRCDKTVNCRTGSDEDDEECHEDVPLWEHLTEGDIAIILVVFFVIMFGMCCTLLFNIIRKLIHDYNVIKEHVAQSRDSQLDQLGRKTPTATVLTPIVTILPNFPDNIANSPHSVCVTQSCRTSVALDTDGCHVPTEHTFPSIIRRDSYERLNGGPSYHLRQVAIESERSYRKEAEEDGLRVREEYYSPRMKDSECQTRESLFHNTLSVSDPSTSPSPPIGFKVPTPREEVQLSPPIGFITFGYSQKSESSGNSTNRQRFRAEAVIEVDKKKESVERPYSIQSAKSAPDVIVTH